MIDCKVYARIDLDLSDSQITEDFILEVLSALREQWCAFQPHPDANTIYFDSRISKLISHWGKRKLGFNIKQATSNYFEMVNNQGKLILDDESNH